jgi:hypothetical protein
MSLRLSALLCLGVLSMPPVSAQPQLGGCPVFPGNHILNTPIDKAPVHARSDDYVKSIGAAKSLHPDFGPAGSMPYNIVPAGTAKTAVLIVEGASESDKGPYPIPANPLMEPPTDNHMLMLSQEECKLYELFGAGKAADGSWTAYSGAIFDLRSNALRPDGWTSGDAAGLAILPGLVRYDEVASGAIRHAIRFTAPTTDRSYVWPARHFASRSSDPNLPPMGLRMRLKAGFDISSFSPTNQIILTALKKYGMTLSDNGGAWFITGSPDSHWNDDDLNDLKRVVGTDFEAVDVSGYMIGPDSAQVGPPITNLRVDIPYSNGPVFDLSSGASAFSMTLTGDVVQPAFNNLSDGQTVSVILCQDDHGYHRFQWPSNVLGGMAMLETPGRCAAQSFVSDGLQLLATSPGVQDLAPATKPMPTSRQSTARRFPPPR